MDRLPLAESDLDEWIKLIILALVFGGSALGGFLKWLVAKFQEDATEEVEPPRPKATALPGGAARPRTATPPPPVARPMPPHPTGRPVARPRPQARPAEPVRSLPRPTPRDRPVPSRPVGRSTPTAMPAPKTKRRLQPDQPLPPELRPSAPEPVAGPHPVGVPTTIEGRAESMGHLDPEAHLRLSSKRAPLGRLAETADASREGVNSAHAAAMDELDSIRHPTRGALRRAIVMNELLGPPLGLRPPGHLGPE